MGIPEDCTILRCIHDSMAEYTAGHQQMMSRAAPSLPDHGEDDVLERFGQSRRCDRRSGWNSLSARPPGSTALPQPYATRADIRRSRIRCRCDSRS